MDIASIHNVLAVKQVSKASSLNQMQQAAPVDSVSISDRAIEMRKISQWVDLLHQMPDVRLDRIEQVSTASISSADLAEKILEEII